MTKKILILSIFILVGLAGILNAQEENAINAPKDPASENQEILITNFIPKEFKTGDVQFSIQIENKKNETINNILAFISGKGFSTYDIVPIDSLNPKEKGYILISGNFKQEGKINLTIRIEESLFYQEVNVLFIGGGLEDLLKKEEEKKDLLSNYSEQLNELKKNYTKLEDEYLFKKDESYDVSNIDLNDLKKYIRNVQSSILGGDVDGTRINLDLAFDEYQYQKEKINNAQKISLINRIKNNAVIFSTIVGALLAFFAVSELLKKKSEQVVERVKKVHVGKKEGD